MWNRKLLNLNMPNRFFGLDSIKPTIDGDQGEKMEQEVKKEKKTID